MQWRMLQNRQLSYWSFNAVGVFCSISPLICTFRGTTVRSKNKRAFVYPWIIWYILVNLGTVGVVIWALLKYNVPVWFVILGGLFNIGYHTWFGLVGLSLVQSFMEVPNEDGVIGIVQNRFF